MAEDEFISGMVGDFLKLDGYEARAFETCFAMLNQDDSPDVVFADLPAKDSDLAGVLHAAKAKWSTVGLVVSVSGYPTADARLVADCHAAGASTVLPKPFTIDAVISAIAKAVGPAILKPATKLR